MSAPKEFTIIFGPPGVDEVRARVAAEAESASITLEEAWLKEVTAILQFISVCQPGQARSTLDELYSELLGRDVHIEKPLVAWSLWRGQESPAVTFSTANIAVDGNPFDLELKTDEEKAEMAAPLNWLLRPAWIRVFVSRPLPTPRPSSISALRAVAGIIAANVGDVDHGEDEVTFRSNAGPTRIQIKALDLSTVSGHTVSDVFSIETQLPEELSRLVNDRRLVVFNTMAALGAMIRDSRSSALKVVSRLSVYQDNEDAWRLYTKLAAFAALLQGEAMLAAVGAALGRKMPKLDLPGQDGPSLWSETDFEVAKERLRGLGLMANAGPSGLTAEVPVGSQAITWTVSDATSLLTLDTDTRHPALGAGLFCKLELPMRLEEEAIIKVANELNRVEVDAAHSPPFFGAWCSQITSGRLAYVSFWPNLLYAPGTVMNISSWMVARHRQALEIIGRTQARGGTSPTSV